MALKFTNFASSTLASSITDSDLTISIQTGDAGRFPTLGVGTGFPQLANASGQRESSR